MAKAAEYKDLRSPRKLHRKGDEEAVEGGFYPAITLLMLPQLNFLGDVVLPFGQHEARVRQSG
jgi:hypothetical protein